MNIVLVTEFYQPDSTQFTGGVEARIFYLAKLASTNHSVTVISRPKRLVNANFRSIWDRALFQAYSLWQARKTKPDIVEGSNFVSYLPAFILSRLKRSKAVAWYADYYGKIWFQTMSLPVAVAGYCMEWLSLRLPWDQIIAMSQATKDKLVAHGVPENKITVIYGGVNIDAIKAIRVKKFPQPTIVSVARLVNYKRIQDIIQAHSILLKKHPILKLVICGQGPMRNELEQLARDLNLSLGTLEQLKQPNANLIFTGSLPQDQVLQLVSQAHVFCLPSSVEGFGLVTLEAMACQTPYVNSDIMPTREITRDGIGGLLYPMGDSKTLASQIHILLTNESLYRQKQAQGQKLAHQFSWPHIINQTIDLYARIAS